MKVVLEMFFLSFSNVNIYFDTKKLIWKTYITTKAMPIARQVEQINKHNFVKVALDENSETFVVFVITLEVLAAMLIHLS